MALAVRFGWTEAQVAATDPDLIAELLTYVRAEHDEQKFREQARTGK